MPWKRLAQPLSCYARQGLSRPLRSNGRFVQSTFKRFNSSDPKNMGQYTPDPTDQNDAEDDKGRGRQSDDPNLKSTILKMLETAATTAASIFILGYGYLSMPEYNQANLYPQSGGLFVPPVLQVLDPG